MRNKTSIDVHRHSLTHALQVGLPRAQHLAAEVLTNMAAGGSVPVSVSANTRDSTTPTKAAVAADTSKRGAASSVPTINLRVEIQRSGAVPALTTLLGSKEEACVQAAATTLYVLAQDPALESVRRYLRRTDPGTYLAYRACGA